MNFDGTDWYVDLEIDDQGSMLINRSGLMANGNIDPVGDNIHSLGGTGKRWTELYATDGVINTSDERLKAHIRDLEYGIEEILQMHPVSFNWLDGNTDDRKMGLIAQEVVDIIPEAVSLPEEGEADVWGMYYESLVPVIIRALQQQQSTIDQKEREITELKARIARIESLLESQ